METLELHGRPYFYVIIKIYGEIYATACRGWKDI